MITTGAKLWLAVAYLAAAALVAYHLATNGEWFGSFILGALAFTAGGLAVLAVAVRDGDIDAADAAAAEVPVRRSLPAGWPALGAVGAGVAAVGLAGGNALLYVGIGILGIVFLEWMVQGWAERATGDATYNQALRNRIMGAFEIPVIAALVIAAFLLSLSRVLLALPEAGATVTAIVVASAILLIAALLVSRPRLGSSLLAGLLAVGAVALIAAGIVSGVAGERDLEEHEVHGPAGAAEEGNNPASDEGGENQSDTGSAPRSTSDGER